MLTSKGSRKSKVNIMIKQKKTEGLMKLKKKISLIN